MKNSNYYSFFCFLVTGCDVIEVQKNTSLNNPIATVLSDFRGFTEEESLKIQTRIYEGLQQKNVYMGINKCIINTISTYWEIIICD